MIEVFIGFMVLGAVLGAAGGWAAGRASAIEAQREAGAWRSKYLHAERERDRALQQVQAEQTQNAQWRAEHHRIRDEVAMYREALAAAGRIEAAPDRQAAIDAELRRILGGGA